MPIDKDTVKYVAHLARMRLDDAGLDLLSQQLEDIVNFIDKLRELDLTGVRPTSHILPVKNVFRDGKPVRSLNSVDALGNAPAQKDKFFIVPRVIE